MHLKRTLALLAVLALLTGLGGCAVNGPYDALSGLSEPAPTREENAPDQAPDVFAEPAPTAEPTPEPTEEAEPTAKPTPEPTAEPTEEPAPTAKPTAKPTEKPASTPKPTAKPTEEPEPAAEPSPKPTAEPTEKPAPTAKPSPRPALWGSIEKDKYVNEPFGLTCTLPDGWSFLSEDELNEKVTGAVEEPTFADAGDDMRTFLAEDENACVAAAVSEDSLRSFNIVVETLSGWGQYISEEDLCTVALHQLGVEEDGDLTEQGLPGGTIAQNTFSFAGEKHPGLYLTFTDHSLGIDMPVYMQFVYLIQGDHAMQITMSSDFEKEGLADIAAMFTMEK